MARKKSVDPAPEPEPEEKVPVDPFITKLQQKIELMLDEPDIPYKERTPLIASAIRFLMVKHKIEGQEDAGSVWDD